jgi:starch-binding outer membrane protein, SusD/RagB family
MAHTTRRWYPLLLAGVLATGACDFDLSTNPNSPDPIGENPSRVQISTAVNGMLIALRADYADYALDIGIMGREVLRIDPSDPRFTSELLHGPLDAGGDAFGGDHWGDLFVGIRGGNFILSVLPSATALTPEEQSATSGWVKTMQALNYLLILNTHTQDSIPIVTGTSIADLAPLGTNAAAFDHVVSLLDQAQTELAAGGGAFPFVLPSGFAAFNAPATFLQFNRGLRARVAVYRGDYAGALTALAESFLDPAGPLERGVYLDYGTGPGDLANPLSLNPQSGENCAHPSIGTGVQLQTDGVTPDQRFVSKIVTRTTPCAGDDLSSNLGWNRYPSPSSPMPILKNEELLLLRAEANIGLNNLPAALPDINTVRTRAGNLPALGDLGTQEEAETELLYNRLYSLMFEGGHRWIDARRYDRLATLPRDRTTRPGFPPDAVFTTLPIPTDETLPRQ